MATNGTSKLDWTKFYNVVDGKLETTSKTRHSVNPSTLEANPEVPLSTPEDVDRAVQAAKKAQEAWADTPYAERQKAVAKLGEALEAHAEEFALMLTKEQGKPVRPCAWTWRFSYRDRVMLTSNTLHSSNSHSSRSRRLLSTSRDNSICPSLKRSSTTTQTAESSRDTHLWVSVKFSPPSSRNVTNKNSRCRCWYRALEL